MKASSLRSFFHAVLGTALLAAGAVQGQTNLATWDFNGVTAFGSSPQAPGFLVPNLTAVGLTRGSGVTTAPTAASNAWGGNGWNGPTDAAGAITANKFATFTLTPSAGYTLSLSSIGAYNIRRSGTGPTTGIWQYSLDGTTFTDIGLPITWGGTTSATGNPQTAIDLSGITALQSIPSETTVTFRVVNWGASGATGSWYFNNITGDQDLAISGTLSGGGPDLTAPTATLNPTNGSSGIELTVLPSVTFSESVVKIPGSGAIELRKADNSLVESFPIDDPAITLGSGNTVLTINPTVNLEFSTSYYIVFVPTVPATGLVEDLAGNDFTGLTLTTDWTFTTEAAPPPPPVVINKYLNASPDLVEILVVGNGVTGTNWDLRGMIIKDFSANGTVDNGGKFEFTTAPLWEQVPVGTLITLRKAATSPDTTVGGVDFNLDVGLDDTTYFTNLGGSFDIATRDFVMIKSSGSGSAGTTGAIHALAATDGSPAPSLFDAFTGQKLRANTNTGTGVTALALNSTSSIADFNGTDAATGGLTSGDFGIPNNGTNAIYIFALRGVTPGDGSGVASIVNPTTPYTGVNIFPANTPATTAEITLDAQFPGVTLTDVVVTVPTELGPPAGAVLSGPGAGSGIAGIAGQVITISGVVVTDTDSLTVSISGLTTPVTTSSDNGNYAFTVQTAISGGTPAAIATQPVARVVIPIDAIRDNDANGVPLDIGTVVAIEGVCTEAKFFNANTLAHLQNGTHSMTIFNSSNVGNPFVRGKRYAVLGSVGHFNGLTQVVPVSFANVVDLGVDTEPAPTEVTIPDLLATPEAYEGRLIKILNVSRDPADSDIWAIDAFITVQDTSAPTPNTLQLYLADASGASSLPNPTVSFNLTGIFSQNDNSSPYLDGYRIMPRETDDIELLGSGFDAWIAGFFGSETNENIIGPNADPDNDNIPNLIEAYNGSAPDVANGSAISGITRTGNTVEFYIQRAKVPVAGLTNTYQWSTEMSGWNADGTTEAGLTVTFSELFWEDINPAFDLYKVTATMSPNAVDSLFIRQVVED